MSQNEKPVWTARDGDLIAWCDVARDAETGITRRAICFADEVPSWAMTWPETITNGIAFLSKALMWIMRGPR